MPPDYFEKGDSMINIFPSTKNLPVTYCTIQPVAASITGENQYPATTHTLTANSASRDVLHARLDTDLIDC